MCTRSLGVLVTGLVCCAALNCFVHGKGGGLATLLCVFICIWGWNAYQSFCALGCVRPTQHALSLSSIWWGPLASLLLLLELVFASRATVLKCFCGCWSCILYQRIMFYCRTYETYIYRMNVVYICVSQYQHSALLDMYPHYSWPTRNDFDSNHNIALEQVAQNVNATASIVAFTFTSPLCCYICTIGFYKRTNWHQYIAPFAQGDREILMKTRTVCVQNTAECRTPHTQTHTQKWLTDYRKSMGPKSTAVIAELRARSTQ